MVVYRRKKPNTRVLYSTPITMDSNAMNFGWLWTWWIVLILFLFFMFNNGWFGWFGWNNAAWLLNWMNNNNNHDNTVDIINNNTMWQNQLMAQQNLANQTTLLTQGFCWVNSNIERAIQAGQQNTAAIITASANNVQKVLDVLCEQETQRLRTELAEARVIAQNNAQTSELLSKLSPTPIPAYLTYSPYVSVYPPTTTTTTANG